MDNRDYVAEGWGLEDCYPEKNNTEVYRKEKGCLGCNKYQQWHEYGNDLFDCRIGCIPENRLTPFRHKPLKCYIKIAFIKIKKYFAM
jgi:hypothetical protein